MDNTEKIKIIQRRNTLKEKVLNGQDASKPGFIDPIAIQQAQQVIENGTGAYKQELEKTLTMISSEWSSLKNTNPQDPIYPEKIHDLNRYTNHVKDVAGTYGYDLMEYFALSLRNFSESINVSKPEHIQIAQAHIDVMWTTFREDIQHQTLPKALELKKIVAMAIDKFST